MPYYYFEAVTDDGQVRKKILKARDRKDADRQIRGSGLHPIFIENAWTVQKKKQARHVDTRRILRRTLFFVAAISLVGGVATYLIMLDLSSVERLDVQALKRSGIIAETPGVINAETADEREFAGDCRGMWETVFPGTTSGITVKRKILMLVYVKVGRETFREEDLSSMTGTLNLAFHKRFDNNTVVLIVHEGETLAESRFQGGRVKTEVY